MRYTERWAYGKQLSVRSSRMESHGEGLGQLSCEREEVYIRTTPWMYAYRDRIRMIDTDEKASQAIRDYWHMVAKDWDNGKGIIT